MEIGEISRRAESAVNSYLDWIASQISKEKEDLISEADLILFAGRNNVSKDDVVLKFREMFPNNDMFDKYFFM